MIDKLKSFWYWGVIIGLIILGIAIYSCFGRGADIQQLFKLRPDRVPGGKKQKLPDEPTIVDYVDLYKRKLQSLK